MILDQKLQRMLNDSKIAQLNSERLLHQTSVRGHSGQMDCGIECINKMVMMRMMMKKAHRTDNDF